MLGASALSEYALSDQSILLAGVSEMSGIASTSNAAVGIMSGVSNISFENTQTSVGTFISSGANVDLSFDNTLSSAAVEVKGSILANEAIDIESTFTETSNGIMIRSGTASKDFVVTQTSIGELLFVEVNAGITQENYTTITPSGAKTYTEIVPSDTETWTEIEL